ncbi:ComEA family DNA-binding protein [Streptomyces cyaneochromogenes]|uniref:ComEA family DNA-binding protein n=1 Tax=Streptomyces cyaneochromogenes TaxID=2496836 RepID=A0A3S9M6B1_9ACTN|nr:ComEA family DNA-binding protein [Streptomyces cyaneochromogenes]AZQ34698.1 ComEA family DNA-binding protein [Streptomyces cyaneochromogenes]
MALRSRTRTGSPTRTRTATVTSGPGRGPHSDVRARHQRLRARGRARRRHASAQELRRRAEVIFAERAEEWGESGAGPPTGDARDDDAAVLGPGAADAGGGVGSSDAGSGDWRGRAGLALRERMPVWLQARCGLERRSVVALSVVLVLAAGFAVQHFWSGRTQSVRAPEVVRAAPPHGSGEPGAPHGGGESGGEAGAGASAAGVPGTEGAAAAEIVVDVSGKVREPGIHRLPAGSRVADALRVAGGVRPGTNTDGLNRARFLVDGEQVIVGGPVAVPGAAAGTGGSGGTAVAGAAPVAPVSLSTATVEQLDTLPGVGPVLAQHIIDYRTRHGGFRSVDELQEVNGIGTRRFADLRNLVRP